MDLAGIAAILIVLAIALGLTLALVASWFHRVGPNQALIVYGFGGTSVVVGGGRIVWPVIQQAHELSLELMNFDLAVNDLVAKDGVVELEVSAQTKVRTDQTGIFTAAELFLTETQ